MLPLNTQEKRDLNEDDLRASRSLGDLLYSCNENDSMLAICKLGTLKECRFGLEGAIEREVENKFKNGSEKYSANK